MREFITDWLLPVLIGAAGPTILTLLAFAGLFDGQPVEYDPVPYVPMCYEDEVVLYDGTCWPQDDAYFEGDGPGGYWYADEWEEGTR
jgi:hypothetical protein